MNSLSDHDKKEIVERVIRTLRRLPADEIAGVEGMVTGDAAVPQQATLPPVQAAPWALEQFFDGQIDLEEELGWRFHNMPVMATVKFRGLGTHDTRSVAALAAQDGSAQVTVYADHRSGALSMVYTLGGMLSLRFHLDKLSDKDRAHWLDLVRRESGGPAFLWGAARWNADYLICDSRRYFTNLYAFSPQQIEAAARLTPDVAGQLFDWLVDCWQVGAADDDASLLSW